MWYIRKGRPRRQRRRPRGPWPRTAVYDGDLLPLNASSERWLPPPIQLNRRRLPPLLLPWSCPQPASHHLDDCRHLVVQLFLWSFGQSASHFRNCSPVRNPIEEEGIKKVTLTTGGFPRSLPVDEEGGAEEESVERCNPGRRGEAMGTPELYKPASVISRCSQAALRQ